MAIAGQRCHLYQGLCHTITLRAAHCCTNNYALMIDRRPIGSPSRSVQHGGHSPVAVAGLAQALLTAEARPRQPRSRIVPDALSGDR